MKPLCSLTLATLALATAPAAQVTRYLDPIFAQVDVSADVVFGSAFNPMSGQVEVLDMDRYEPAGDSLSARPAVVVVHGGGFLGGDKADAQYVELSRRLAQRGFVAVSINYRTALSQAQKAANFPLILANAREDFHEAVRFVRQNASAWRIDTERIATYGASAGSTTALEAGYLEESPAPLVSSQVQAVVDMWGQLVSLDALEAGDAPLCIVHGMLDTVVPFQKAVDLHERAVEVGLPNTYHPIPGTGHAPWGMFWNNYFQPTLEFIYEHLELGKLSGLALRPGYQSPGLLLLDSFGSAGDLRLLGVSTGLASIPLPPLGELCLNPGAILLIHVPPFPGTAGLSTQLESISVPAGLAGVSVPFQELQLSPVSGPRLLTNCVLAIF